MVIQLKLMIIIFTSGSLLAISEALPFIDSRGNGIIDKLKKIRDEYNQLK